MALYLDASVPTKGLRAEFLLAMTTTPNDALDYTLSKLRYLEVTAASLNVYNLKNMGGGSCDVYRAQLRKGNGRFVDVAVKRIRATIRNNETFAKVGEDAKTIMLFLTILRQSFAKEMYSLSKIEHKNIIQLEGYVLENGFPTIILEWAEGGTVIEYIKANPDCDLVEIVCLCPFPLNSSCGADDLLSIGVWCCRRPRIPTRK